MRITDDPRPLVGTRTPRPPFPRHVGKRLRTYIALLAATCLTAAHGRAEADCASCPQPTTAQLVADGYQLEMHGLGIDELFIDGGECSGEIAGPPTLNLISERWDLRASGEVKNCPHEKTTDTVMVQVTSTDSTSWTSQSTSAELNAIVAKVMSGKSTAGWSHEIQEVTSVAKKIEAGWCLRVPYKGFLRTADYTLTIPIKLTRRYAWWTKKREGLLGWSSTVYLKGMVAVDCGVVDVMFHRRAALEILFSTQYNACDHPACDPVVTPSGEWSPPVPQPRPTTPAPTPDGGDAPNEGPADPEDPGAGEGGAPEEDESEAEEGDPEEPEGEEPEEGEPEENEPEEPAEYEPAGDEPPQNDTPEQPAPAQQEPPPPPSGNG